MTNKKKIVNWGLSHLWGFLLKVMRDFKRNQGMLLSGAVAYYTLLSIVPMSILALIVLSHFVKEEQLLQTLSTYLELLIPGYAATLTSEVRVFLGDRKVVGIIGFLIMLFFSSIAFTTLENAMSVIFYHRVRIKRRSFLISVVIPYVYIGLSCLGILLVSFIVGAIEILENRQLIIFGLILSLEGASGVALYLMGIIGEMLMFTSIYLVMPVVPITFRHVLIGGMAATVLWEIVRRLLVWYYSVLSMVNLIYGSFATAVVALLSIEAAVLILLLGAQVIAELEPKSPEMDKENLPGFET
jgi:YihY family inner membrane protein